MRVLKHLVLSLLFSLIFFSSIQAKIYIIPESLKKEVFQAEQIAQKTPTSAEAQFELAMAYGYTGQVEKGWACLKKIPNLDPNYAPKVVEKYSKLIQKEPQEWRHYFKIAFGYFFIDEKEKCIESFNKVLEIDPKNFWVMAYIGLVEGERGNIDKGMEWSKKALAIEPNATAVHFLIAEGYRRKGDYLKTMYHLLKVGRLKTEEALYENNEKKNGN